MKILLAVDGSPLSDAAIEEVVMRPWPAGSELKIITVIEPTLIPTVETWVLPNNYYDDLQRAAE